MITQKAQDILQSMTKGDSLLRHARTVELVMRAYAEKLGQHVEQWGATGLLHDADYEAHPDQHPNVIVNLLRERRRRNGTRHFSALY
ncbi:hypothetical protein GCM10028895_01160 [Pontibacter rugosus]